MIVSACRRILLRRGFRLHQGYVGQVAGQVGVIDVGASVGANGEGVHLRARLRRDKFWRFAFRGKREGSKERIWISFRIAGLKI
jgi:hypothetical protein